MNIERVAPASLSDGELLVELTRLAHVERRATVRLIAALAEVDARGLHLGQGYSSLFVYCTRVLFLSEDAAYNRIEVARVSRRFPVLLEMLERGDVTLTAVRLLAPHLRDDNVSEVLTRAKHRTKREVEEIVASLQPEPDVPSLLRRLPKPRPRVAANATVKPTAMVAAPRVVMAEPRPVVQPLAPERYKLQVTIGRATEEKLRRAQDLMRHLVPSGDLAVIVDRALDVLLEDLRRKRIADTARPRAVQVTRAGSRHIPAAVRRVVWSRDEGRCAFSGARGRCEETAFLEFHHARPFADGGDATTDNIELRCRAHNQHEATLFSVRDLWSARSLDSCVDNSFWNDLAENPDGCVAHNHLLRFPDRVEIPADVIAASLPRGGRVQVATRPKGRAPASTWTRPSTAVRFETAAAIRDVNGVTREGVYPIQRPVRCVSTRVASSIEFTDIAGRLFIVEELVLDLRQNHCVA